jgi:hypothetical protein
MGLQFTANTGFELKAQPAKMLAFDPGMAEVVGDISAVKLGKNERQHYPR